MESGLAKVRSPESLALRAGSVIGGYCPGFSQLAATGGDSSRCPSLRRRGGDGGLHAITAAALLSVAASPDPLRGPCSMPPATQCPTCARAPGQQWRRFV